MPTDAERITTLEALRLSDRREHRRLRDDHDKLAGKVGEMARADEIAVAVADEIAARRRHRFRWPRKLIAALAAGIVLIPAVHDAFTWWS